MFEINSGWIIRGLYKKLLGNRSYAPPVDGYYPGFIVPLDCSISQHSDRGSIEQRHKIFILICAPHHAFVYFPDTDESWREDSQKYFQWQTIPLNAWRNVGNHDSCWIDSVESALNHHYFEMCHEVNPGVAPASLSHFTSFGLNDMWTEVLVKREPCKLRNKKHDEYWYKITEIKVSK